MNSATTAELTCVIVQVQKGVHNELSNTTDLTCVIVQVMGGSVVDLECFDADPNPTFQADMDPDPEPDLNPKFF